MEIPFTHVTFSESTVVFNRVNVTLVCYFYFFPDIYSKKYISADTTLNNPAFSIQTRWKSARNLKKQLGVTNKDTFFTCFILHSIPIYLVTMWLQECVVGSGKNQ